MYSTANPPQRLPTLVLMHGLLSSPLEFALIVQILRARDVPFDFLEIPGYTHGCDRPRTAWREWVASADAVLDARYGADEPLVLGGLGVGGALAVALALGERKQKVTGVALLSPTFDHDGSASTRWRRLQGIAHLLGLDRRIEVRQREPFGIKNAKTRKWVARELAETGASSTGPASMSLCAIREGRQLHAHVKPQLTRLPCPLLVLHATEDETSSLASVERWVREAGPAVRLIALDHSFHMITIDNDRQRVAHELADFIGAPKRTRAQVDGVKQPVRVQVV